MPKLDPNGVFLVLGLESCLDYWTGCLVDGMFVWRMLGYLRMNSWVGSWRMIGGWRTSNWVGSWSVSNTGHNVGIGWFGFFRIRLEFRLLSSSQSCLFWAWYYFHQPLFCCS